jgi:hypothetical protein
MQRDITPRIPLLSAHVATIGVRQNLLRHRPQPNEHWNSRVPQIVRQTAACGKVYILQDVISVHTPPKARIKTKLNHLA